MKIDIIIPVYNEEKTIIKILDKIKKVKENFKYDLNIIVVNDGSTDNTLKVLSEKQDLYNKLIDSNSILPKFLPKITISVFLFDSRSAL